MIITLIILGLLAVTPCFGAFCGEACNSTTDCSVDGCYVCIGHCVGCHALADATSCADTSSGADLYCTWKTAEQRCAYIGELPEIPARSRWWVWIALVALGGGVVLRRTRARSSP